MQRSQLASGFMVVLANRFFSAGSPRQWNDAEEILGISLNGEAKAPLFEFVEGEGKLTSALQWAEGQARLSPTFFLLAPEEFASKVSLQGLPPQILDAVRSGGLNIMAVNYSTTTRLYLGATINPPRYTFSGAEYFSELKRLSCFPRLTQIISEALKNELNGLSVEEFYKNLPPTALEGGIEISIQVLRTLPPDQGPKPEEEQKLVEFLMRSQNQEMPRIQFLPFGETAVFKPEVDVTSSRLSLSSAVNGAREFALRAGLKPFAKQFDRALLRLSLDPQPLDDLTEFMQKMDLPKEAIQLARASEAVLQLMGGNSSWSELQFEDALQETFTRVTRVMLMSARNGLQAAINSSATSYVRLTL